MRAIKCLSNKELNKLHIKGLFLRKGNCKNCNGRCCNFIGMGPQLEAVKEYWKLHGALVIKDKWNGIEHLIMSAQCKANDSCGKCMLFNTKKMPLVCSNFPMSPDDGVYRYLMQIGKPCGFYFVDRKTGKKWNMRRKTWKKTKIVEKRQK